MVVERNVIIRRRKTVPVLNIDGQAIEVSKGVIMRTAIVKSGGELYKGMTKLTNCGGVGSCSTCWVNVLEGGENLSPLTTAEEKKLAKGKRPKTHRMACQALVNGNVAVEVP